MEKKEEQKALDEEFLRECEGYTTRDNKPDGAYIKAKGKFFNLNKIKHLIEAGAYVGAKDRDGETPLHKAVESDNIKMAKFLIDSGADVNDKNSLIYGHTPLHYAVDRRNIELVKLLIDSGADFNIKDNNRGYTPLHYAVERKNIALVELFLSVGADVMAKNNWDETPLHLAVESKNIALVELLIKAGATK